MLFNVWFNTIIIYTKFSYSRVHRSIKSLDIKYRSSRFCQFCLKKIKVLRLSGLLSTGAWWKEVLEGG